MHCALQVLSTRLTGASPAFTKGARTRKVGGPAFDPLQLGHASPGPVYDVSPGLGKSQVCTAVPVTFKARRCFVLERDLAS
jgi:hypothetical protein